MDTRSGVMSETRSSTRKMFDLELSKPFSFEVPSDLDKPWITIASLPFPGDTRLSCIYVPGKPEPLLMAGSPTEKMQKLCHLNLMEWRLAKQDERLPAPKVPVVEEKFSRPISSLWPESREAGQDPETLVALPVDCTADLPVSRHSWVTTPILPPGGEMGPPPLPGHRPPFDFRPGPRPGPPPGFEGRAPRPPFDYPGPPPGFEGRPARPPFDYPGPPPARPPFDGPPPGFGYRPPFDPGPPPGFDQEQAAGDKPHRRRRHRHRRGEGEGEGEGRKRRRAEKEGREDGARAADEDAEPKESKRRRRRSEHAQDN